MDQVTQAYGQGVGSTTSTRCSRAKEPRETSGRNNTTFKLNSIIPGHGRSKGVHHTVCASSCVIVAEPQQQHALMKFFLQACISNVLLGPAAVSFLF